MVAEERRAVPVTGAAAARAPSSLSFVCCVESGPLELQTVRLVETLRRFGGPHADAEILAVTPRFGAPLHPRTLRVFAERRVRYLRRKDPRHDWFGHINKAKATALAEVEAQKQMLKFECNPDGSSKSMAVLTMVRK